jgi:hypothetical protein
VTASNGDRIPLDQLVHISTVEAPAMVNRGWGKRRIIVQANVRGRDVGSFVADARDAIDKQVELPPGYYVCYGGQFEHLEDAKLRADDRRPDRARADPLAPLLHVRPRARHGPRVHRCPVCGDRRNRRAVAP